MCSLRLDPKLYEQMFVANHDVSFAARGAPDIMSLLAKNGQTASLAARDFVSESMIPRIEQLLPVGTLSLGA
jgi:hypothetical protein